jgi:Flp pilus assembly protein TadG
MIARIGRFLRCSNGSAAMEVGVIFPFFFALVVGTAQYGLAIYQIMEVQYAAQVGADFALTNGFDAAAIQTAVTSATAFTAVTAPTPTQACGCASVTGIATATCGTPCADGTSAGTYVTVTASAAYSPVVSGIPSPLVGGAMVRIQ